MDQNQEFLTPRELSKRFRVAPYTIGNWVEKGYFPALRLGPRTLRIRTADFEAFLKKAEIQTKEVNR